MDFFLDTGIFLGLDYRDDYNKDVNIFLTKYPSGNNKYYSAKAVKKELNKKRREFTKRGWSKAEIRRVWQIIITFYRSIEDFVYYEDSNNKHPYFGPLYNNFYPIVAQDYFDATILANAFIWCCEKSTQLCNPILVTTDDGDFYKQKQKIFEIAKMCTKRDTALDIQCVWDNF